MEIQENLLLSPLWAAYREKTLGINLDKKISETLKDTHNLAERKQIYNTIKQVIKRPKYDFQAINNKIKPFASNVSFNNEEIYNYLTSFKNFMENVEYGLLTDDRLTNKS